MCSLAIACLCARWIHLKYVAGGILDHTILEYQAQSVTSPLFRSNWVVDPNTGTYTSNLPTPTGIASDPALAGHGVNQSKELATHISKLDPPVDVIYSSPFYRCLQTLAPTVVTLNSSRPADAKLRIHVENGLGEFYGLARFDHPSPATLEVLATHFPDTLEPAHEPAIRPSVNGESLDTIHDRIAYCLHRVIAALDADPKGLRTLLICTHAASMICIGRALTGIMPEDFGEEDFKCFTCSLSKFTRRKGGDRETGVKGQEAEAEDKVWDASAPETIPEVKWREGRGVRGGWDCIVNGDCSFLEKGEERGWKFSGDESFLKDPNAFNDAINTQASEGEGTLKKGFRL
ncbi:hypothetical protein MBLNU459_g0456t1 [Dothideomycetes sp. NU459]